MQIISVAVRSADYTTTPIFVDRSEMLRGGNFTA
jgi:hypothetical protein